MNFTPKMTPNGRPCTPTKYFNHAGTRWGANNFGKSGGGRSNFKILWLDHEIAKNFPDFYWELGELKSDSGPYPNPPR